MSEHYNQNYTKEECDVILRKIKRCVNHNKFTIEQNRNSQLIMFLGSRLDF